MMTEETCRSRSPKKNRGINWSDEATEALLESWAEESIQMCLQHTKSSKETQAVYCCLSTLLQLSGNYFNPKELQSFKEHSAVRRTFQRIVHGVIFVNRFFCVLQYVI